MTYVSILHEQHEKKLDMQKRNLFNLSRHGQPNFAQADSWFPYTSGQIGSYFIQSIDITKNGFDYKEAILDLVELIKMTIYEGKYDAVFGGESRDWDFSNPVAVQMALAHAKLYKDKEPIGAKIEGGRFIGVSDLNNEGSSYRDQWVPTIKNYGGEVVHAFFYVDRLEDGVEVFKDLKIPTAAVVPFDARAWQILKDINYIDEKTYLSLNERMEDKTGWARDRLFNQTHVLENLLNSPKLDTQKKGFKILSKGYPEFRDELIKHLEKRNNVPDLRVKLESYLK